jgi:hypothetical protein
MKKMFAVLIAVLFVFCGSAAWAATKKKVSAEPKAETSGGISKMALGFNSQLTCNGVTSLALRMWTTDTIGIEPIFGFALGDNTTFVDAGVKILSMMKKQENLNYYAFGLLGIENYHNKIISTSDTYFTVGGGLGVEFFIPGISNLGISAELGLGYNSGTKTFATFGDWISAVGARYYFK